MLKHGLMHEILQHHWLYAQVNERYTQVDLGEHKFTFYTPRQIEHLSGCFFEALAWPFLWYGCLSSVVFGTPLSRVDLLMPTPSLTSAIALSMSSSDNFPYLAPGGRRRGRRLIVAIFPSEKQTTYHVILVHENYNPYFLLLCHVVSLLRSAAQIITISFARGTSVKGIVCFRI